MRVVRSHPKLFFAALALAGCDTKTTQNNLQILPERTGQFVERSSAGLQYPVRLAVAPDGLVLVSDPSANRVVGYRDGAVEVVLADLDKPLGVAVHEGRLYVGNAGRRDVEVYDLGARKLAGVLGAGVGEVEMPNAIAVAPDGVVYVADSKTDLVKIYSPTGARIGQLGGDGEGALRFPSTVAADASRVVVGDQGHHRIVIFDRGGAVMKSFGEEMPEKPLSIDEYRGRFTTVQSVALAGDEIFVLDSSHSYVQVFDAEGTSRGVFGYAGECATCVTLALDIARDGEGAVLATDPVRRRVVALDQGRRP